MNSILNKNLSIFKERFPDLYNRFSDILNSTAALAENCLPENCEIIKSKNNLCILRENGILHHSLYDPEREVKKIVQTDSVKNSSAGVFYSFGLGYGPIAFATEYPDKHLIIIEPDVNRFLLALSYLDWSKVFSAKSVVCFIGADFQDIIPIEEKIGIANCSFFSIPSQVAHAQNYFNDLEKLTERNRQKKNINDRTLEKFSHLWLKNTCKNNKYLATCSGITDLKDSAKGLRACVLAAGPSLDYILPFLSEIKKRSIIICVDTALKSCLKTGVQPDYIILVDPQYWNARHIHGLSAPESTLITEIAAWPSVFHFPCKEIRLCASQYPLGKYLETAFSPKGTLAAGGSVATTAWDFARYLGCTSIFLAGMDLGFPDLKTHSAGCQFEERVFTTSNRFATSETSGSSALYSAFPFFAKNYKNLPILTDKRMSLYAWWFESKCAANPDITVYSLTPQSLKIPGINHFDIQDFLTLTNQKYNVICLRQKENSESLKIKTDELRNAIDTLGAKVKDAIKICNNYLYTPTSRTEAFARLQIIDKELMASSISEILSLVFPTENQLEEYYKQIPSNLNPEFQNIQKSFLIYKHLQESIKLYLNFFTKYF